MDHLKIRQPIRVPNLMFFHPKWLDNDFKNMVGSTILQLRPTEKSNLKRLLFQTLNIDRCVTKWGDIVQMLLRANVTDFTPIGLHQVKSWHELLIYIVNIIGQHQGWDPKMIAPPSNLTI